MHLGRYHVSFHDVVISVFAAEPLLDRMVCPDNPVLVCFQGKSA